MELVGVTAGYRRRGRPVARLRDVSMHLAAGSTTALNGPNGSGKSTLLRLCVGLGRPWSGRLSVAGAEAERYLRAHGVGYLPEETLLPRGWTLRELLAYGAALRGCPARSAISRAERLGLARELGRPASRLSKGQRRRAGLAWALTGDPGLMLLDEPSSGLDGEGREALGAVLRELQREGATVVLVTHDPELARSAADRVVTLRAGRVASAGEATPAP